MKFTLSWLKEHLDTDATLQQITDTLTATGLELEGIEDQAAALSAFTVAHVVSAEKHPDADRLQVCMVDTGSGDPVQVVCGAPNARAGMKGVFAPAGTHVPGTGIDLKKGVIRGVESNGMLCSEREMGLSDDHEGIIDLPEDAEIGTPFATVKGLDDPMIEIAITPNRQDALGVYGVARDLAAASIGTLKPLDTSPVKGGFESPIKWARDLPSDNGDACPLAVGRYFRNIKNGPSPAWMQQRLRAIGLRPISALVDITNYVTYDLARPLHVFDADKIDGDLTMRMAKAGESILALDGKDYALDGEMTVIADKSAVLAIGGVMGGEATGCTNGTTNVFLEVALFDPIRTATTGRKLNINSDARYRFERGVDPESAFWGAEVATRLILELCGGEASQLVSAGEVPEWQNKVVYRPARFEALTGVSVPDDEAERILSTQGFVVDSKGDSWSVDVPSWRIFDVDVEADLIEDVLRIHGYDKIPNVSMAVDGMPTQTVTGDQRRTGLARRALAVRGMLEAITWSFMPKGHASVLGGGEAALTIENPIAADLDQMRPSILGNLLSAAQRNADRGIPDVALFEIGPIFAGLEVEDEAQTATGIRTGTSGARHWSDPPRPVDVFDAKADALAALEAAGAPVGSLQTGIDAPDWYHPGRSGTLKLGKMVLAAFGEIHPRVLKRLDVNGPAVGFEVMLDALPPVKTKATKARKLLQPSPYQAVSRDFAFVVDGNVAADTLVRSARNADKALIAEASVFDVYEGANIGEGKKSVALTVTLQPAERTLTDAEIEAVADKIVAAVGKQTGGILRG